MAGFNKLRPHARHNVKPFVVRHTNHLLLRARRILHRVQRLGVLLSASREKLGILFLNVSGVGEHYRAEVARRSGCPDRVTKSLFHQERQATRVIDVCV